MDSLIQKAQNLPHKTLILVIVSFAVGLLVASLYWQNQIKDTQSSLGYKNFEVTNLQEQITTLRDERYKAANPSPTPAPIPYVKKESLEGTSVYTLSCYDSSKDKTAPSWVGSVQSKLESEEKLVDGCLNESLNKVALLSTKEVDKGGFDRPGVNQFKLGVYSLADNKIDVLSSSQGSYLGGYCTKIVAWTKTNNLYYQCGGGDGPWGDTVIYQVNLQTKEKGITESCSTFEAKTSCTNYCQSNSDCQPGSFCNLERNNCIQSCTIDKDCVNSSCQPYGPAKGCAQ